MRRSYRSFSFFLRLFPYEKTGEGGRPPFLCGPDDGQLLGDTSEVRIAGDQRGFAKQGQGGCEAIDVWKLVVGFEFGGTAGKFGIGRNDGDRQLGHRWFGHGLVSGEEMVLRSGE